MSATLYARVVGGDCAETQDAPSMVAFVAAALGRSDERAFAIAEHLVDTAMASPNIDCTANGAVTVIVRVGGGMPAEPTPDEQLSGLHRAAHAAQDARKKIERRAGRALRDPEGVLTEQGEAIDVFSAGDYSNLTIEEIGKAGRRIARLSDMLVAADEHRYYVTQERQAKDRLAELRERIGRAPIRPVRAEGRSR